MKKLIFIAAALSAALLTNPVWAESEIMLEQNPLIAYFSYTGNTRKMAEKIQELTGGELLEITPSTPYSEDYDFVVEQGNREQKENYLPPISTKIEPSQLAQTIIIGSPIWWFDVAPPVKTFLKENDFSGKNVILFVTHGGYGPGRSQQTLQDLCQGCQIAKVFDIEDKMITSSEDKIKNWLIQNSLISSQDRR